MLGKPTAYDKVPYFFSDQYDLGMEYTGFAPSWDEVVFRGNPAEREFIAFWLHQGRVVAGMNANIWDVAPHIEALVRGWPSRQPGTARRHRGGPCEPRRTTPRLSRGDPREPRPAPSRARLLGQLVRETLLDELFLTVSPVLVVATAPPAPA